jgi:sugar-phosphatase
VRALFPDHSPRQQQDIWRRVDQYEETAPCDPIPGVVPLLRQLSAAGVAVALVTSSWPERIQFVLAHLELVGVFATVVNRTEVPRGKPHPDPYLTAADRLGVTCDDLLVFEDSANGILSALDAKAHCVGVGPTAAGSQGTVAVIPDFTGVQVISRPNQRPLLSGLDICVVLDESAERL